MDKAKLKPITYEMVKNLDWIELDKNCRIREWYFYCNFNAVEIINKKYHIPTKDEWINLINETIKEWEDLDEYNRSTKVKDFFDLLWIKQCGFRNPNGGWHEVDRYLWSASASWVYGYNMTCCDSEGKLLQNNQNYGFGVWFLEDYPVDNSYIWLFEQIVELCESVGGKCWTSFWYKLWKLLDDKNK